LTKKKKEVIVQPRDLSTAVDAEATTVDILSASMPGGRADAPTSSPMRGNIISEDAFVEAQVQRAGVNDALANIFKKTGDAQSSRAQRRQLTTRQRSYFVGCRVFFPRAPSAISAKVSGITSSILLYSYPYQSPRFVWFYEIKPVETLNF
jgi:hypothetical protein